ncbi:MAG TPA: SDR family oxidoreductase [Anaerolineales bacterium]
MKHVVITGSTRGLGFGLADAFLELGCSVTVSGRMQSSVAAAVGKLNEKHDGSRISGCACDVRHLEQIRALWDASIERFKQVDVWINNAGFSGPQLSAWKIPPDQAQDIIQTNLLGVIYGSMVSIQGMLGQGYGSLYNMEGMGSDGRKHNGLALYGTTKYGVHYFTECLVNETQGTPLVVGSIRPGMLITDMILKQYEDGSPDWERAKRVFNLLADRVETVAPWLAAQILANQRSGACIRWLTKGKLMRRMLFSPFQKRDLFGV